MDKERLPRWGWLLVGLFAMSVLAQLLNQLVLFPAGLPEAYQSITVITLMSPVLIYVGVWYDDDRQHYWERSRERIVADVAFVLAGAALGSSVALVAIVEFGLPQLAQDLAAMAVGFMLSWGLFWWRNPEVYRSLE
ncbi:hypothetical protein [Natronococcus jeotgali]|uniref:GtrA family protein n=1 Tax=Natronococcus jeotgali DSM 18795 TaxID=1227498 RepID=L9XXJ1_9EURY|nr:hypothetical protein [Natronococcus jeotgali]ELY65328.1 hypothetical protein C492_03406 [Natronococcus jeotgali DSM 18795]